MKKGLIFTHNNSDFDGIASAFMLQKIFNAKVVMPERLEFQVEAFLHLYEYIFPFVKYEDISFDEIDFLVFADISSPQRIGSFFGSLPKDKEIEVHIFDHHSLGYFPPNFKVMRYPDTSVGSAVTLVWEELKNRGVKYSEIESTLMLLGVYEDTGRLLYSSTTYRDANAVADLIQNGASLMVVSRFLESGMNSYQRQLLEFFMDNSSKDFYNGVEYILTYAELDTEVEDAALVVHKLRDLIECENVFAVLKVKETIHIIARGLGDYLNVRKVLEKFGGGGHNEAAAATFRLKEPFAEFLDRLRSAIQKECKPKVKVRDVMTSPVRVLTPETSVEEARKIMLRYGHSGVPIISGDEIVGVLSRKDIDKATQHKLDQIEVQKIMSRNIITISQDASLDEAQKLLIEKEIGRLPVINGRKKLVGLITRTDILRVWHGLNVKKTKEYSTKRVILDLNIRLDQKINDYLEIVSDVSEKLSLKSFVVGGCVRDLLLNMSSNDMDIVVEGDAIKLAEEVNKYINGKFFSYEKFRTATIKDKDIKFDFASARTEFYNFPAAKPLVEYSDLHNDMYRRDFSINTLAISLNRDSYGKMIDFFDGYEDIKLKRIRVLHPLSYVEDPTRIIRAIRFEFQLGFMIDKADEELIKNAMELKLFNVISFDVLKEELKILFSQGFPPELIILRMKELSVFKLIHPKILFDLKEEKLTEYFSCLRSEGFGNDLKEWWFLCILPIIYNILKSEDRFFKRKWRFTKKELLYVEKIKKFLYKFSRKKNTNIYKDFDLFEILEGVFSELICFLKVLEEKPLNDYIKWFDENKKKFRPIINGEELSNRTDIEPAMIGEILKGLKKERFLGNISSYEDEIEFIKKFIHEKG
jgi:tRNA nucleotidyltransferase (CCA-adding enzyme)